jgi:hypothetical protein
MNNKNDHLDRKSIKDDTPKYLINNQNKYNHDKNYMEVEFSQNTYKYRSELPSSEKKINMDEIPENHCAQPFRPIPNNEIGVEERGGNVKETVAATQVETVDIPRKSRCWFFILILTINLFVNLENGTIPSATDAIKESLKVNEEELGLFGSLLYVGNAIGNFY